MSTLPRATASADCVTRDLLERQAAEFPDKPFALFEDGTSFSYIQTLDRVRTLAANLRELGVNKGDRVLCWLPNGRHGVCLMLAANHLGAVYAPLNTEYRGALLEYAIRLSGARLLIAHAILVERLQALDLGALEQLVVIGTGAQALEGIEVWQEDRLSAPASLPAGFSPLVEPHDIQALIFTSGTTGPSKAVPISYLQSHVTSTAFSALTASDRALLNLPMFHVGGMGLAYRMLARGGSIAVVTSFSSSTFWETVRQYEVTTLTLLGAMTSFLLGAPPSMRDRMHPLRHVIMVPVSAQATEFAERFGVDIYTVFNMTELACPIVSERNPSLAGSCGKARTGMELRIVDEAGCDMPDGMPGELVARSDIPGALATQYLGNPQATAATWRNGWFHTGDRFRRDAQGNFYFVDRLKDAIRRRGENMSASEIENEIRAFPGVLESAVIGVPSEHGEEDVLAAVQANPGAEIDPEQLLGFLRNRLPGFMVPRYVRLVVSLPRTPSQKIMKYQLRAEGVAAGTWDRESAGIHFRRTRFPGEVPAPQAEPGAP